MKRFADSSELLYLSGCMSGDNNAHPIVIVAHLNAKLQWVHNVYGLADGYPQFTVNVLDVVDTDLLLWRWTRDPNNKWFVNIPRAVI